MLTPETIELNWKRFYALCEKLGERSGPVIAMLDELDERLCLCPASSKKDYHSAYPGGLVDHSLRVLQNLVNLNKTFGWGLAKDSMIVSALFHDVGKVGLPGTGMENDFYMPQTDGWRQEKLGEVYMINDKLTYMTTSDRTMYVMHHYGVKLSPDEALAIRLNDGFVVQENKPYCLKISPLVFGVMTSDYAATMEETKVDFWPHEEAE